MDYEGNARKRKQSASADTDWNTSSASASSAAAAGGANEVFLSFRGKDTRFGFTDFLYNDLLDAGIRTFRDDDELRVGEEIGPELLKAIKESKISIPIFSSGYASSKWCLLELVQMVECHTTMGQKIFPIFYDVEPPDVRHQTGSYEEAFRQHEMRFGEKTVEGWKEALREVGKLKGWELEKQTNGHQGELVKMVVLKVLLELKKNYMFLTDNLVGIDHHVEKMMGLLNFDPNDVSIVGIHGMGGIGKTTIVKVIYNLVIERFECCCFLADVREKSQQRNGLVNLQNQFISKLVQRKYLNIDDVDEGINMIKDMVGKKKVLIVLDDVDKKSQFDKLVGKHDWFGLGSRIIVTTRNKEVLDGLEVAGTYEPQLMELDHSLQLFSKHAFRRDFPPKDYDTLSRKVVSIAAGLPLALEIIGSLLLGKRKVLWEDTLKKLNKIPNEQVEEKLIISYEALDNEQKQIFLDIACFFIGKDKSKPFYMWDDCEFYPTNGINVLVLRSLVKIGDDNKLWMHDQLRDLGREIVRKENFKEPRERSRLWLHEDVSDILEERRGAQKVEALCLETYSFFKTPRKQCFTGEEFGQLPNLRFLQVDCTDLVGDFKHLLSNLRWLHWQGCPGNFVPTNFHPKNLIILDLSCSRITEDWKAWSQIKMAKKLKVLDLSNCFRLIKTPEFSTFASLERLILRGCSDLVQIDSSIGDLRNLRVLDIAYSGITKLPDAFENLEKLEEIDASFCRKLQGEISSNIDRLSSLRILRLCDTNICSLPTSLCGLSCLQTLDLCYCTKLRMLPELPSSLISLRVTTVLMETFPSLSILMNLEELMFQNCLNLVKSPRDIGILSKLETLTLCTSTKVQFIPQLPSSLFKLCLSHCYSVEGLLDVSNLKNLSGLEILLCPKLMEIQGPGKLELLTSLELSSCENLAKIKGFEQLESLIYLKTPGCFSLERLPDLSNLRKLKILDIRSCSKLVEIRGLEGLESLEILSMFGCKSIKRLYNLSNSGTLKHLMHFQRRKSAKVEGIRVLRTLKTIDMSECILLERLPDLSQLGMLEKLNLCGCQKLAEVEGPWILKSLKTLDMSRCTSLERLPDLSHLGMLEELNLCGCQKLAEVEGSWVLKSLKTLDMSQCTSLERLPDLSHLGKLEELNLCGCQKLAEVEGPWILKSLKILDMSQCTSLETLPDLSQLGKLEELNLCGCQKLAEVEGFWVLKSLKTLDMSRCTSLERLPDLSHLGKLEELNLCGCQKLAEVEGLWVLKSLKTLDMSRCTSLKSLPDLSHLGMLEELNLCGYRKLAKVGGPWVLKSLKTLDMSRCISLKSLPNLSHLGMLEELNLCGCLRLAKVEGPWVLKSLKTLDMSQCISLERLPDLSHLGKLEELNLCGCQKLAEVEGLWVLKSLKTLDMSWCTSLESLPDLSHFGMLEELNLCGCGKLAEVEGPWVLKSLKKLDMSRCTSLESLPDLSHLGMLEELNLCGCRKLAEVEGPWVLKSLKTLHMSQCISLKSLPDLSHLGMLEELNLCGCQRLAEVEGPWVLKSLKTLDMSRCTSLERLPDLSHLGKLEELNLCGCQKLAEVEGLWVLKSLKTLHMSWCTSLESLLDLSHLGMLEELNLCGCQKLSEV